MHVLANLLSQELLICYHRALKSLIRWPFRLMDYTFATANYKSSTATLFSVRPTDALNTLTSPISYPLPLNSSNPSSIAFSFNTTYIATANSNSNDVTLFKIVADQLTGAQSYALPANSTNPASVAFSPNEAYLAVANRNSNDVTIFNVAADAFVGALSYLLPNGSSIPEAVAFTLDGTYLATTNTGSNDITLFKVTAGVLNSGTSQQLPAGSKQPQSLAFLSDLNGNLFLATANSASNDVTIFSIKSGIFTGSISYPLPQGNINPQGLAIPADGTYLATANSGSNSISIFTLANGTLEHGATSYSLPGDSIDCVALSFWPTNNEGNTFVATANLYSNDVSVFRLLGGASSGDGGSSLPLGAIIGTTVGAPLGLVLIATGITLGGFLFYKYMQRGNRRGNVNFDGENAPDTL